MVSPTYLLKKGSLYITTEQLRDLHGLVIPEESLLMYDLEIVGEPQETHGFNIRGLHIWLSEHQVKKYLKKYDETEVEEEEQNETG